MSDRRTFLRQLAGLPLIGGAVMLIGQPSAVAELASREVLESYFHWLRGETYRVHEEMSGRNRPASLMFVNDGCPGATFHQRMDGSWAQIAPPSTRAALVLSAVGCNWRRS